MTDRQRVRDTDSRDLSEIIAMQEARIACLESRIAELTADRDAWYVTAKKLERERRPSPQGWGRHS